MTDEEIQRLYVHIPKRYRENADWRCIHLNPIGKCLDPSCETFLTNFMAIMGGATHTGEGP